MVCGNSIGIRLPSKVNTYDPAPPDAELITIVPLVPPKQLGCVDV